MRYQSGRDITFIQIKTYIHLENRLFSPKHGFIFILCLTDSFDMYFLTYSLFPILLLALSRSLPWTNCGLKAEFLWGIKNKTGLFYFRKIKHPQVAKAQCMKCKVRLCQEFRDIRNHSGRHEVKVKCEWMERLILWEDKWLKNF